MSDVLVVAFGGNAILPAGQAGTAEEQRANVRRMASQLGKLVLQGHQVIVTHGNGPQVGEIMLKSDIARDVVPPLALDVAGAMSQGQIGYLLQQEVGNYLSGKGAARTVCSVVTQVVVDERDPAFQTPTKPIGRFYTLEESISLGTTRGWNMVEDAGRGYRRVVPSPIPIEIVEWPAVKALAASGVIVIAAGGGGVPVVRDGGELRGVEAVIDKDFASQILATLVDASTLVLLTGVEQVCVDFGTQDARALETVSMRELRLLDAQGQFPMGSMGPKVKAAIGFLEDGGRRVIITSPEQMMQAIKGTGGTQIVHEENAMARPV